MIDETIQYSCNDVSLSGYLAYTEDSRAKRAAIIVAHTWRGQDEFAREKARELADMGYVGFAADVYGQGKTAGSDEEALRLMLPLFLDRNLLRSRICAAADAVKRHPFVDENAIGAIGFCFGGLTVIELLRSGYPVRGVVSFHGLLGFTLKDSSSQTHKAKKIKNAADIKGSLLILHGFKDPLVSEGDIQALQQEFSSAGVPWQMNIYGEAAHAFTNPEANDPAGGMQYQPEAAFNAWLSMCNFFEDLFPL